LAIAVCAALVSAVTPVVVIAYRAQAIRHLQKNAHVSQQACNATAAWFLAITTVLVSIAVALNISSLAAAAWFIGHMMLAPAIIVRSWLPVLILVGVAILVVADAKLIRLGRHP